MVKFTEFRIKNFRLNFSKLGV